MKKLFLLICFFFCCSNLCVAETITASPTLKRRQPNWRPEIVESYSDGNPKRVIFYEPNAKDVESAVKELHFGHKAKLQEEVDLCEIDGKIMQHGAAVTYHPSGAVASMCFYEMGVLNGQARTLYPNGQIETLVTYKQGIKEGVSESYYPNGSKKEEASYQEGRLTSEVITYHEDGSKASLTRYVNGIPHGEALEWYSQKEHDGRLKATRRYFEGVLHGDGSNPAVVIYGLNLNQIEVQDFRFGKPYGVHYKYHPNGKISYKVNYSNGLKEGKEQYYDETGILCGEGIYKTGVPMGEHCLKNAKGQVIFNAKYNQAGKLLGPIQEFYSNGKLKKEYILVDDQLDGKFKEWDENGHLIVDYFYSSGSFQGEQKEYFPNGQLKLRALFQNKKREGLREEWFENGQIAFKAYYQNGIKEGALQCRYLDGKLRLEENYVLGKLHGLRQEWFENGQVKSQIHYQEGEKQGLHQEWNKQGDLVMEVKYLDDKLEGTLSLYWRKNQPKQISHFKNGRREGVEERFYENGTQQSKGFFVADKLDGLFQSWYPDGSIHTVQEYRIGIPCGEHREYYPKKDSDQKIMRVCHFNNGNLDGELVSYFPNGQMETHLYYRVGKLHGTKSLWDKEGRLLEEGDYVDGKLNGRYFQVNSKSQEVITFFKDDLKHGSYQVLYPEHEVFGKVKAIDAHYKEDKLDGEVCEYNEAGVKISSTFYRDGLKEGIATLYSEQGQLLMTMELVSDERHGLAVSYYPNGKIYRQVSLKHNLRDGETKTFFEDGTCSSIYIYKEDKLNGHCVEWNKKGLVTFEGEYVNDVKHGRFNKYYDNGKPKILQVYENGQLCDKKAYDEQGKLKIS